VNYTEVARLTAWINDISCHVLWRYFWRYSDFRNDVLDLYKQWSWIPSGQTCLFRIHGQHRILWWGMSQWCFSRRPLKPISQPSRLLNIILLTIAYQKYTNISSHVPEPIVRCKRMIDARLRAAKPVVAVCGLNWYACSVPFSDMNVLCTALSRPTRLPDR
jgi:hypothetical protein